MGRRVARFALIPWVALYFLMINPVVLSLIVYHLLGLILFAVLSFLVFVAWSLIFYYLLSQEGSIDRLRNYLDRPKTNRNKNWFLGLMADISERLEKVIVFIASLLGVKRSIYLLYLASGPLFGTFAVKAGRLGGLREILPVILLGCALSVVGEAFLVAILIGFEQVLFWLWGWLSTR